MIIFIFDFERLESNMLLYIIYVTQLYVLSSKYFLKIFDF